MISIIPASGSFIGMLRLDFVVAVYFECFHQKEGVLEIVKT